MILSGSGSMARFSVDLELIIRGIYPIIHQGAKNEEVARGEVMRALLCWRRLKTQRREITNRRHKDRDAR